MNHAPLAILTALGVSIPVLSLLLVPHLSPAWAGGPLHTGAKSDVSEVCNDSVCHVKMMNGTFTAGTLFVRPNSTVVWTNLDPVGHSVTSGNRTHSENIGSFFDSGPQLIQKDENWEHRFNPDSRGSIEYFCVAHPMMVGKIVVEGEVVPEFPQLGIIMLVAGSFASIFAMRKMWRDRF